MAPSKRSSARARSSRAALAASSAARASRSASASAFSACCKPVGAVRGRCGLRGLDLGDQRAALLGENLRCVFQLGAVALGLGNALFERGDLVARALLAFDPAGLVGGKAAPAGGRQVQLRARWPAARPAPRRASRVCRRYHRALARALFRDLRPEQARRARFLLRFWRPWLRRGSWSAARALRPAPKAVRPDD